MTVDDSSPAESSVESGGCTYCTTNVASTRKTLMMPTSSRGVQGYLEKGIQTPMARGLIDEVGNDVRDVIMPTLTRGF